MRPNLVVVGVGHSGTTILTKMISELGWCSVGADERYLENTKVREANRHALTKETLPVVLVKDIISELNENEPWVIKDPRFTVTLHLWKNVFTRLNSFPVVIKISKDLRSVKDSYIRRKEIVKGKPGNKWKGALAGCTVDEQVEMLDTQLASWQFPVIDLTYSQLKEATNLFFV